MKLILILSIISLSVFSATETRALSCLPSPGAEVEFQEAGAVFTGEAKQVSNDDSFDSGSKNYAKFRVDKIYKGDLPREITIETDGTWGMRFEAGKQYLVYLDKLDPYVVELCKFGTMSLEDDNAWGRIQKMEADGNIPSTPNGTESGKNNFLKEWKPNQVVILQWTGAAAVLVAGYLLVKKIR